MLGVCIRTLPLAPELIRQMQMQVIDNENPAYGQCFAYAYPTTPADLERDLRDIVNDLRDNHTHAAVTVFIPNQITGQHNAIVLYKNSTQRPVFQAYCFDRDTQEASKTILATLAISQPRIVRVHDAKPSLLKDQADYRTMMACDAVIRALPGRPSLTEVTMTLSEHHFTTHASRVLTTVSAQTTRTTWFADDAFTKTISDARNVIACPAADTWATSLEKLPAQIPRRQHGALITALGAMATFPYTAPKNDAAHRAIIQAIAAYWEDRVVQLMKRYSQSPQWEQYLSDRTIAVKQQMLQAFFTRVSELRPPPTSTIAITAELAKKPQKPASAVDRVQQAQKIHDFFTHPGITFVSISQAIARDTPKASAEYTNAFSLTAAQYRTAAEALYAHAQTRLTALQDRLCKEHHRTARRQALIAAINDYDTTTGEADWQNRFHIIAKGLQRAGEGIGLLVTTALSGISITRAEGPVPAASVAGTSASADQATRPWPDLLAPIGPMITALAIDREDLTAPTNARKLKVWEALIANKPEQPIIDSELTLDGLSLDLRAKLLTDIITHLLKHPTKLNALMTDARGSWMIATYLSGARADITSRVGSTAATSARLPTADSVKESRAALDAFVRKKENKPVWLHADPKWLADIFVDTATNFIQSLGVTNTLQNWFRGEHRQDCLNNNIFRNFVRWEITADGSVSGTINPEYASLTYPELLEAMRAHAQQRMAAEDATEYGKKLQAAFEKALTKHCPVVALDRETLTYSLPPSAGQGAAAVDPETPDPCNPNTICLVQYRDDEDTVHITTNAQLSYAASCKPVLDRAHAAHHLHAQYCDNLTIALLTALNTLDSTTDILAFNRLTAIIGEGCFYYDEDMRAFTCDYDLLNQTNLPQLVNQALYKLSTNTSRHYQTLKTQIDGIIGMYGEQGLVGQENEGCLTLRHTDEMAHCNASKPALYHGDFIPKIQVADAASDTPLSPQTYSESSGRPSDYVMPTQQDKCERAIERAWQNLHDLYIQELEEDAERLQQATMHTPSLGWCEALSEAVGYDNPMPRKQAEKERLIALRTRALQSQRKIVAKMVAKYNALCDQYEQIVEREAAMAFSFKRVDLPKAYIMSPNTTAASMRKRLLEAKMPTAPAMQAMGVSMTGAQKRRREGASCFSRLCC